MVSDDSGKSKTMTFGWATSTHHRQRLATVAGHCQGKEISLRAEAAGMLSASVFVELLQQYSKFENDPLPIIYVSDNLELISKGKSHKNL